MQTLCMADDWRSPYFRDHPLVGKIWDTQKGLWLTEKQLLAEVLEYEYVLLGETHTNPDHHILQARIINHISSTGAKPIVVMEMLANKQWQHQPKVWKDLEKLKAQALAHNDNWPWKVYTPVLQSIVQNQLQLIAGNISSSDLHDWSKQSGSQSTAKIKNYFSISNKQLLQLKQDIIKSHCGHANPEFVQFMVRAQLRRDQELASNLVSSSTPAVLIAGSGHIKNSYAVPMQLSKKFEKYSYLTVSFKPVVEDLLMLEAYIGENSNVFDIIYFTPNQTNQDPCIRFQKQLKKMHMGTTE